MAIILGHVDVQAILQTSVVPQATFGLQLFLTDDDQIPIDQRFLLTDKDSFDDYDSASDPYLFAQTYFAQKRVASEMMLGRWVRTNSAPYWIAGPAYETDYTVWKAVTDGSFTVQDNTTPTPLEDDVSGCDFSGVTDLDGILTVLNAKLAAIAVPNITGLDSALFSFDILNRLILTHSQTGAAAKTLTIIPTDPPVGTDLAAGFMDNSNGSTIAGLDAEEPEDALAAISAKSAVGDSFYNVALDRAATDDQMVATASYIEAKTKLLDLVITAAAAKTSATTDVGSRCKALGLKRTMCIYTEKVDEWPDAATAGAVLPATEGTTNWAYEVLSLVSESGLSAPLDNTAKANLENKNINRIEALGANIFMYDGITSGDIEKRIMLGRDWFEARIAEDLFSDLLNQPLRGFTNATISNVVGIVKTYGEEAIDRGIGVNTPDRPFTIDAPDADDFTTAQRASHRMELGTSNNPFFTLHLNSAVNDYTVIGVWNI
ncbi:DUF3383 family protein [candidate division KSB1 bacterium]|nr:DUF3383 family protein [candidate division KSB1 bacterium]